VDVAGNAVIWNGHAWGSPVKADSNVPLAAVSCLTSQFCVAVESGLDAVVYRNGAWSQPAHIDGDDLESVACASSTFCVATDDDGRALAFSGTAWGPPEVVNGGARLGSVACPASNFCVAVSGQEEVTDHAGSWGDPTVIDPNSASLGGSVFGLRVSCATSRFCAVVDGLGRALAYGLTVVRPVARIVYATVLVSKAGSRVLKVRIRVSEAAKAELSLLAHGAAKLSGAFRVKGGGNTLSVDLPRTLTAGTDQVRVTLTAPGQPPASYAAVLLVPA
jgi:hypothetical protein